MRIVSLFRSSSQTEATLDENQSAAYFGRVFGLQYFFRTIKALVVKYKRF